jgi:hypothetical protein
MQTLNSRQRLATLDSEISQAEPLARAEKSFKASNPEQPNPWQDHSQRLEHLLAEREEALLVVAGERLNAALEKRRDLQSHLDRLHIVRQAADRQVLERSQHPVVQRYKSATAICMQQGWGHSWELFRQWFESNRSVRMGCPETANFFLHAQEARDANVRFDLEGDRAAVALYNQSIDAANQALGDWNSVAEALRLLLREHPELVAAS